MIYEKSDDQTNEKADLSTPKTDDLSKNADTSVENSHFEKLSTENSQKNEIFQENVQKMSDFDNDFLEKSLHLKSTADRVSEFDVKTTLENCANSNKILSQEDDNALFSQLFPGVIKENIEKDPKFKLFAKGKDKNASFCAVYGDYLNLVNNLRADIEKRSEIAENNKQSSPGALSSPYSNENVYFTKEQVQKMTREQIARHYGKIRESQQKW